MGVWVLLARAVQPHRSVSAEPISGRIEARMLSGKDQERLDRPRLERGGDWSKLDGLGSSPNDDCDGTWQLSP